MLIFTVLPYVDLYCVTCMSCYLYECRVIIIRVIDLGVMTPAEKIIKTAIDEKAGIYE